MCPTKRKCQKLKIILSGTKENVQKINKVDNISNFSRCLNLGIATKYVCQDSEEKCKGLHIVWTIPSSTSVSSTLLNHLDTLPTSSLKYPKPNQKLRNCVREYYKVLTKDIRESGKAGTFANNGREMSRRGNRGPIILKANRRCTTETNGLCCVMTVCMPSSHSNGRLDCNVCSSVTVFAIMLSKV